MRTPTKHSLSTLAGAAMILALSGCATDKLLTNRVDVTLALAPGTNITVVTNGVNNFTLSASGGVCTSNGLATNLTAAPPAAASAPAPAAEETALEEKSARRRSTVREKVSFTSSAAAETAPAITRPRSTRLVTLCSVTPHGTMPP